MSDKEKQLDYYIKNLLDAADIKASIQGSSNEKIKYALATASKNQKGHPGRPEFCAVVDGFVIIVEDKSDLAKLENLKKNNEISLSVKSTQGYAVNGAVWYLKKILEKTDYEKGFAIGAAGNENLYTIKPYFIDKDQIKPLEEIKTFKNFSPDNIEEYYKTMVLGEEPLPERELKDILDIAEELSEELRTLTNLTESERSILVAAVLLALNDNDFKISELSGDDVDTDTEKVIRGVKNKLIRGGISKEKSEILEEQFKTILGKGKLNQIYDDSDPKNEKTIIRHFVEKIHDDLSPYMEKDHSEDYLGRFYEVFLRYSKEGKKEGIILTPPHVTDLMVDLIDIKYEDKVLDPCCGTGTFLVSAMNKMLKDAENVEVREDENEEEKITKVKNEVKSKRIYGIEERDDLFSVASTNMILRGDGQSNIFCDDFFDFSEIDPSATPKRADVLNLKELQFTKGLMNPPYAQRINKDTAQYSEIHFVFRLLNSIKRGGKVAVLVPLSSMTGKNNEDREIKKKILETNTLEGVITLQKDTFHTGQAGVQPCIAVFKVGRKHNIEKDIVKFINFQDDGYQVYKHVGLLEGKTAKDKKQYLLDVWNNNIEASNKFCIKSTIQPDDEWLHSFYYFNDEIPTDKDFEKAIGDYLTFEFSMIMQNREYLFEECND